ncbi:flavodoxin I [Halanaerobium saccharolyticum]|uniref:Flavodoxin n=1 Tax=Halanaerobium saccharolyticum TaxID=43595 RepID=A0A4R7ZBN1_9FIRM|nr:flavodoxin [Halanaerobium saccharolyticum]RAK11822.1 flavodoxin I [Halanaerobium saccharolyticum]TDW07663.1 flavodoxin I [Halanaerobium saccharolyticum]TDX64584.1 flavodoxin I [Halanaerobium saccharolyticum]
MSKIGVFYGSTTGDTEELVMSLAAEFKDYDIDIYNVNSAAKEDLESYDNLIFASSTWGFGELQDDWADFVDVVKEVDLSSKKVAFIGTGDQDMYPDTFIDAIGIIYEAVKDSGAEFVGQYPVESYDFNDSRAVVDGKLIGLAIDNTNQEELTAERLSEWSSDLF